jgi:prevent-host-death family protein
MASVSLAEAKAQLSKLVARAAAGETVQITRRGRPVAQITAVQTARKRIDPALLRAITSSMPPAQEAASDLVRRMRDTDRY